MEKFYTASILILWFVVFIQSVFIYFLMKFVVEFINRFKVTKRENKLELKELSKGEKAPYFSERDQYGETVKLSNFPQQYKLLIFVSGSCGTCHGLLEELPSMHSMFPEIVTIIIASSTIQEREKNKVIEHFSLIRSDKLFGNFYVEKTPTVFLINQDDNIINIVSPTDVKMLAEFIHKELHFKNEAI